MMPETKILEYDKKTGRYDEQTRDYLDYFLKESKLKSALSSTIDSDVNICFYNDVRVQINKFMSERRTENGWYITCKFNHKEEYKVCQGMPVICTVNIPKRSMYNSEIYALNSIKRACELRPEGANKGEKGNVFVLNNGQEFDQNEFCKSFTLAYGVTVYKYQGGSIDKHYNIYIDSRIPSKREMYTALSRTTRLEFVHLNINPDIEFYNRKNIGFPLVQKKWV